MTDLPDVLNWRRLSANITLSGQPTELQLAQIKESGITHVINLGPYSNKGALADEPGVVESLDMVYVYIPVDFENPTDADFTKFCAAIESFADTKIHVHCIYNARVTAFFYKLAKLTQDGSEDRVFKIMDGIWRPGGVWASFIGDEKAVNLSNRYAGYDY